MARTCRPFTALDIKQCATGTYAVGGATGLYFRKNKSQSLFFFYATPMKQVVMTFLSGSTPPSPSLRREKKPIG